MSEQEDALQDLEGTRVLDGLRWAAQSSAERVLSDFDADTGHDQGWLGYTHHKLLKDRIDRVFSCGKYAVPSPDEDAAGMDVLGAGLSQQDLLDMPHVSTGVVLRDDLNGSPGWRTREWRWLLASFRYGDGERIPWPQKSPTKQRVAAQPQPDQLAFDAEQMGMPGLADVLADLSQLPVAPTTTLVMGHSLDPFAGGLQLPFGRPRLNHGGGDCWYWMTDLLDGWNPAGGRGRLGGAGSPAGPGPNVVPDAPVRLRRQSESAEGTSGDQ